MSQPYVHPFYRIWFTTVDPIVLVFTALACIFSSDTILETVVPREVDPSNPVSNGGLLHQAVALYAFCGIIHGVLLRVLPDPRVWKTVQAATLGVDISLLATLYNLLRLQGRTDVSTSYCEEEIGKKIAKLICLRAYHPAVEHESKLEMLVNSSAVEGSVYGGSISSD